MILSFNCSLVQAQINLVKDINQNADVNNAEFESLTDVNGVLYFTSKKKELWKTDGTEVGSLKLKEFNQIFQMKKIGGSLFFFAADATSSTSLWKSDGAIGGTVKVSSKIVEGSAMTDVNGVLFFIGRTAVSGLEIWRSDGTQVGTYLVKDIMKGGGNSNPKSLVSFGGKLFFVANNGTNGYEIWESNGTTVGTHIFKDLIPGKTSSVPSYLTAVNNTLFFMAKDVALGQELWKADGTVEGTVLVKDIKVGLSSSFPDEFIAAGGLIFFRANDGQNNFQLWRSDGTAEGTFKLTTSGFSWVNGKLAVGDALYYILGNNVFRTDGTVAGTQFVCEIEDFESFKEMAQLNGSLYVMSNDYTANDLWKITGLNASVIAQAYSFENGNSNSILTRLTSSGNEIYYVGNGSNEQTSSLWKSDGTPAGTASFLDLYNATANSYPNRFVDVNGTLFFSSGFGGSLWKSDGTDAGTIQLSGSSLPYHFNSKSFNGNLFYCNYQSLYKSDGTVAGTVPVTNLSLYPNNLSVVGGSLYFKGGGYELWKTDGTEAGTVLVKAIATGSASITDVNGIAYFSATDGISGYELWKSDGTTAGTLRVKDINPGSASSTPMNLVAFNNQLFFIAFHPANGFELWKSDGTESGTVLVKEIHSTVTNVTTASQFFISNGILYFVGRDDAGFALWKTDGTTDGTVIVKDFYTGLESIDVLKSFNNELYMLVGAYHTYEIWKSNGTEAGTIRVKKIGTDYSLTSSSEIHNGYLYITTSHKADFNSTYQQELWRTDGTTCGTFRVDFQSRVSEIKHSGSTLFMAGYFDLAGLELLSLEDSEIVPPSCAPVAREIQTDAFADYITLETNAIRVMHYPNPFNNTFSLRVNGEENTSYSMQVVNVNGQTLENHTDLNCNVEYAMGGNLREGIYLIKVEIGGKLLTSKIMKMN